VDNDKPNNNILNAIAGTVDAGENDANNDFVEEEPGSWSGNVSKDTNNDDNGEVNLENVTITLYTDPNGDGDPSDGVIVASTLTDVNGNYSFTNLNAGDYVAVETQPAGLLDVVENEGGVDNDKPNNNILNAIAGTVDAGENDANNDFVEEEPGSWSGNVSKDTNNDDNGEVNLENVTITLYTDPNGDGDPSDGVIVASTLTDVNGNYSFTNLNAGDYVAVETQPAGLLDVVENEGGVDNDKPNNNILNAIAGTVDAGENDANNDFVEEEPGSWSGNVSRDDDKDGIGDTMLENVTITLYTDPNGDGDASDGSVVATTETDAAGNYTFTNLTPGDYVAVETQPVGHANVSENEGGADNDKPDNNILNAIAGTVDAGENDANNDFIEEGLGSLSGNVSYEDSTGLHPIENVTLVLFDENGNEVARTTTDSNGNYTFINLLPGEYLIRQIQPDGYDSLREDEGGVDNDGVVLTPINEISAVVGIGENDVQNDFVEVSKSITPSNRRPTPTPTPTPRPNPVAFNNASQIADVLNDSPIADVVDSREGDYFRFVAQQSGLYIFSTDINSFTGGAIYDRNEVRLNGDENIDLGNFTIRQTLKNGEEYYIRVYANIDTDYVLTIDFTSINDFVERFYEDMLGRSADATGLQYWVDLLSDGVISGVDMAHGFGSSTEFINRNLNDNDYLTALYQTFFDRTPDTEGLVYWLDKLQNGVSRSEVLEGFANSKEFKEKTASYGIKFKSTLTEKFVNRLYTIGLTRYPDGAGFRYWVNGLTQGQFNARIAVTGFVFSDEFINRNLDNTSYVTTLYSILFDRAADTTGLNTWITKLNNGETREMVLDGFLDSQEFIELAKKYGIRRK